MTKTKIQKLDFKKIYPRIRYHINPYIIKGNIRTVKYLLESVVDSYNNGEYKNSNEMMDDVIFLVDSYVDKTWVDCWHIAKQMKIIIYGNEENTESEEIESVEDGSKPFDINDYEFKNYLNPEYNNHKGYKTIKETFESISKEMEQLSKDVINNYCGNMLPSEQFEIEYDNIIKNVSVRDYFSWHMQWGYKETDKLVDGIRVRQRYLKKQLEKYDTYDRTLRKWICSK